MVYRILYIEDNFQNKRLVRKILTAKGFDVLEADDGLTGVEMATNEHPDLILMDISLPGIDGVEATQRIKAYGNTTDIPIIALTANAMRGDRERFIAAGCDDYLPKPISTVDLINMINRYLSQPGDGTTL
jgi:two-component system cell cycle response regulator DivK